MIFILINFDGEIDPLVFSIHINLSGYLHRLVVLRLDIVLRQVELSRELCIVIAADGVGVEVGAQDADCISAHSFVQAIKFAINVEVSREAQVRILIYYFVVFHDSHLESGVVRVIGEFKSDDVDVAGHVFNSDEVVQLKVVDAHAVHRVAREPNLLVDLIINSYFSI